LSYGQLVRLLSIGNLFEAGLWIVFAVIFVVLAIRCTARKPRLSIVLAMAFAAFAVSDVIESHTGAWWRPLWLLLLKGSCITVFCYAAWEYRRIKFAERNAVAPRELDPT